MEKATPSNSEQKLRVLLVAYACEPGHGSEPGTGWNMAMGLAREHDVTVVTRANNRHPIEEFLHGKSDPKPKFIYADPPRWVLALKRMGLLSVQMFYAFWQWQVFLLLRKKVGENGEYDIVHQLTFNSFEVPPFLFLASSSINVWGPMGGGQTVPFRMLPSFGFLGGMKECFRNARVSISSWNPVVRKILTRCSLVLFANGETRRLLKSLCSRTIDTMIDVGVETGKFTPVGRPSKSDTTTVLFAGRLEARKGLGILLEAFADLTQHCDKFRLRIVGDGPSRRKNEKYVRKRGLSGKVQFVGLLDHDQMVDEFVMADIFVFPSLRDTSGTIVLEAMSMGLPTVCFDHQGAAIMVCADCGIKVPVSSRSGATNDLKEAIMKLGENLDLSIKISMKSKEFVRMNFDWDSKVRRISAYYRELVRNHLN